jgi:hypothetical protein
MFGSVILLTSPLFSPLSHRVRDDVCVSWEESKGRDVPARRRRMSCSGHEARAIKTYTLVNTGMTIQSLGVGPGVSNIPFYFLEAYSTRVCGKQVRMLRER